MKRLIVNADDFGLTKGVNRAIAQLHHAGSLTSATLMANGSAFEDAVDITRQAATLDVGCHVVLVDGRPASAPSEVPTLLERGSSTPTFHSSLGRFALALYAGTIREQDIEREALAQIRKLQQAGVHVSHVDTHKHTHMFPRVLRPLIRAAKSTGVQAIRNPFEVRERTSSRGFRLPGLHRGKTPIKRGIQVGVLSAMRSTFQQIVRDAALRTTDGALGVIATGILSFEERLGEILDRLPHGTWELVCHPGVADSDLDAIKTRLRASRAIEMFALKKLISYENLLDHGIVLSNFEDLNPDASSRIQRLSTLESHSEGAAQ